VSGLLQSDATVVVLGQSDAQSVYARGYFGTLTSDRLTLDRFEAVYLSEMGRLQVEEDGGTIEWPEVFRRATRFEPEFGIRYIVYRDLRQRGYVVRKSSPQAAFSVLPRGGVLHKTPARFWIEPYSERTPFDLARVLELADRSQIAKKSLLLALVDEESDLTYYRVRRPTPTGSLAARPLSPAATGWLSEDRVVVFDGPGVETLGGELGFGSKIGSRLEVSLLEATYLAGTGQLVIRDTRSRRVVALKRLLARARRLEEDFDERSEAYRTLRERHLVVKTGFKYGAHFRAYPRRPEHAHARYLVQAVRSDYTTAWPEIAGAVRVAQGVRKELLVASVTPGGAVRFLALERVRP
jgi:tRNA-intron endonuclease